MFETVLNHTYAGNLKKETSDAAVKNLNDYGKWDKAQKTYLVCKIESDGRDRDPVIITNTPGIAQGNHAEEKLIQRLINDGTLKRTYDSSGPDSDITNKLTKMSIEEPKKESRSEETKTLPITIYIKNSTCSNLINNCADKLIKMLDSNVQVSLILYVANLYNVRRETCKAEEHNEHIPIEKHTANYRGLRNLMQHKRSMIIAFSEDIWEELF